MHLKELLEASHDKERALLVRNVQVVAHVHPKCSQLGHTVVAHREPIGDHGAVDLGLSVWLSEEGHAEGGKVGPQDEVERVEVVGPSPGVLHVVLPAKLALGGQLHPTVIQEALRAYLGIVLPRHTHTHTHTQ